MKNNLLLILLVLSFGLVYSMCWESRHIISNRIKLSEIRKMLLDFPSLKFIVASQFVNSQGGPTINDVGEEQLIDIINKIQNVQECIKCTNIEKKFFVNLINSPDLSDSDIKKYFSELLEEYKVNTNNEIKFNLINLMLLNAVTKNRLVMAKILISEGANVNFKDQFGKSALILATNEGNEELVKILLDQNADVNVSNTGGWTPLMLASWYNFEGIVKLILSKDLDVNIKGNRGQAALMYAVSRDYRKIAQLLIERGANGSIQDDNGNTALVIAQRNGFLEIVKMLSN